jgi:type I restriction enzyme, S subunit
LSGDARTVGMSLSELAPGWKLVTTDQAGDVLLGRQRAPQYLTGKHTRKYLRVANVKDDAIKYDDVESMDFDDSHFAKYRLTPGDILVSEGQSPELLGQSAIFRGHAEPLCFQKTLHRFRARPGITTTEFAQIVFRAHVKSGVFRRIGSVTTNIGHLTLEKFRAAPFPLPPLAKQHRIVAEVDRRLSIVREVEAEVDANLKRAQALRQAVLSRVFSNEPSAG